MKKSFAFFASILLVVVQLQAQLEPTAGNWKTWLISSGKDYRLLPPSSYKEEIAQVLSRQQTLDSAGWQQIIVNKLLHYVNHTISIAKIKSNKRVDNLSKISG